jgi:ATP-dependent DNA helicase RecG
MLHAFSTTDELSDDEIQAAPVRYPSAKVLAAPLKLEGAKAQKGADTLGLHTVGDLLEHLPRDSREARRIADLITGEAATMVVEVRSITARAVRRRGMRPLVEAVVSDGSGSLKVTFFNQPWLVGRYPVGTRLMLHGKAAGPGRFTVQDHAPTNVPLGVATQPPAAGSGQEQQQTDAPTVSVALYPASDGLTSTQILALVHQHEYAFDAVIDPLPTRIRRRERLPERRAALKAAHFPRGPLDQEDGRRRLAFDELLLSQLTLQQRRRSRGLEHRAPRLNEAGTLTQRWLQNGLPFPPTGDQSRAFSEIDADIARSEPMQRLLMGEVGSGKTVVALYTMLRAVESDMQAALMAPTETLAEQHFATVQKLLGDEPIRAGLLTGSTPGARRKDLLAKLASGELSMIVGTHALIEDPVIFEHLAVAVVDEQHRFGVSQRARLDAKGLGNESPHVLHMTATPIPRTLALSHYGDLDFTMLRELPRGRQPIATHVCSSEAERSRAYTRIREELDQGRQAFVVCPLVAESETLEATAATAEYERLRNGPLQDYELVLMHGQMKPAEKQDAMARFAAGDAHVLVATTVIEVGIDVPNATVMLVEDADRYGISQLHQLRGRIGRGEHASLCLLFGRKESLRLKALERESDGFALAEVDLELRGEGELAGTRQSGAQEYKFAELPRDAEILERARLYGRAVIDQDPGLEDPDHQLLRDALETLHGAEAKAPIRA